MNYVSNPNFPKGKVTVAAVSTEAKNVREALESAKIAVVPIDPCSNLPEGIASHADLQLLHLGSNSIISASCSKKCRDMLSAIGFDVKDADSALNADYPGDCIINVNIIGNRIIMNPKTADKKLIDYINENNMEIIVKIIIFF